MADNKMETSPWGAQQTPARLLSPLSTGMLLREAPPTVAMPSPGVLVHMPGESDEPVIPYISPLREETEPSLDVSLTGVNQGRSSEASNILGELQRMSESLSSQLKSLDEKVTALNVELSEIRATTTLGGGAGISSQTIPLSALDGYIDEKIKAATNCTIATTTASTQTKSVGTETECDSTFSRNFDYVSPAKITHSTNTLPSTNYSSLSSSHDAFLARLEDELRAIRSRIQ